MDATAPEPRRFHGEAGVSLILALGFIVLFGLTIPPLLNQASASLLSTSRLQEQRAVVYAADGATDGAIQYLRAHPECGIALQIQTGTGSCAIATGQKTATFSWTGGSQAATTTITATGSPLDIDRSVDLSTSVASTPRVQAHVVLRDSQVNGSSVTEAPVDVQNWKYIR